MHVLGLYHIKVSTPVLILDIFWDLGANKMFLSVPIPNSLPQIYFSPIRSKGR